MDGTPGDGQVKKVGANESGANDRVDNNGGKRSVIEVVVLGLMMRMRTGVAGADSEIENIAQTSVSDNWKYMGQSARLKPASKCSDGKRLQKFRYAGTPLHGGGYR